jgi:hypothetical protein
MGNRVFLVEHQRRTLEVLLMISRSPWRWVPEKLLYPLYGVFLLWAAGLPFYWVLAVLNYLGVPQLMVMAGLMWTAGLLGLAQSLLGHPETWPGFPVSVRRRPFVRWLEDVLPTRWVHLQLGWYVFFGVLPWVLGYRPGVPRTAFFSASLAPEQGVALQLGLLWVAALAHAWAVANPGNPWVPGLARAVRRLVLLGLFALFLGSFWQGADPLARGFWVTVVPVVVLLLCRPARQKGSRREDRRSEGEIRRLQDGWDNPLFIRDLRALLRPASLAATTVRSLAEVFVIPLLLAALSFLLPGGGSSDWLLEWLKRTGYTCAITGPPMLAAAGMTFAGRARRFWDAERQRDTLGHLLSVPLSAAEIVRGRWGASGLRTLPFWLASLLCCLVGVWMLSQTPGTFPLSYLGLVILAALYGIGLGALASGVPMPRPRFWHFLLVIPIIGGPIFIVPFSIVSVFDNDPAPDWMVVWTTLAYISYPLLAGGSFWAAVRNIEWLRERDAARAGG